MVQAVWAKTQTKRRPTDSAKLVGSLRGRGVPETHTGGHPRLAGLPGPTEAAAQFFALASPGPAGSRG
ncbi:MAG: hypothetical protein PHP95_06810 [Desulfuromonadaceae bacterium]|nr:hypothetical protein [Desulfuromonadaceae bacterium]MDD2848152.1 hypothetical protein [Desulfuromonadaceae bacterium]MDD4132007.1 hypothetical protein [Desulfuromonadaceae bacterium]